MKLLNGFNISKAALAAALITGSAWADLTPITSGLNAPAIGATGGAQVIWGPIVSQSTLELSGSANTNYPQKIAGSTISGNGGQAGGRNYCFNNSATAFGPGTLVPPSTEPVYEWFCNYPSPPAPQVNFDDYKFLAQQQGNSCGGSACYNSSANPHISGINDPVCTVNGQPKVWFFEGNPTFSGGTYFCGVMVSKGSVGFTGSGTGILTTTPPSEAWRQYLVATPNGTPGFGDTTASDEYPGDGGLHAVKPYTITSGVTFKGYIFASTGYSAGGGSTILGAVQFGAGAASSSGGGTIFFQPTMIFSPPPPGTVNMPIITPPGGHFMSPVQVSIAVTTPGAEIHYTLDGTTPNSSSPLYTGPFTLSTDTIVKAIGTLTGMNDSAVASAVFTFGSTPVNPAPILTSLVPDTTSAGSPAFTITANGSNFMNGAVLIWNGGIRATTFVNSGQLRAAISAADVAVPGIANVIVANPDLQASNMLAFTIVPANGPGNPAPILTSLTPNTTTAGSPAFTMLANGSQFISGAVVTWNGSNRPTTFLSPSQLSVAISAADVVAVGTATVRVVNPDAQLSAGLPFTITAVPGPGNPAPILTSLTPNTTTAGSPAFTMLANGSQFVSGAVVTWNGSNRTTTFVSASQLRVAISAADVVAVGTATVRVVNPDAQLSAGLPFTITAVPGPGNPAPILTSLTPNTTSAGSPTFTMLANGSQFVSGAVVTWNGSNRATTFISAGQLRVSIAAGDVASAGTASVRVVNPDTQMSGPLSFTITPPVVVTPAPILNSLTPNTTMAGSPAFTLTANGSQFLSGAVVTWNSSNRPTTFVSASQLRVAITAADVATAGTASVRVVNPDAQTSSALPFTITAFVPPPPPPPPPSGPLPLDHVRVVPSSAVVAVGDSLTFNAMGYDVNNTLIPGVLFDWSVTGSNLLNPVAASASTVFTAGTNPGVYTLTASSGPKTGTATVLVQGGNVSGGLYIVDPARATPNPVPGTLTHLHVLAASTNPGPITYQWDFSGLAAIIATPNAHDSDVTFTQPGTYQFNVTMRDSAGLQLTTGVSVTVVRTVTRVVVSPQTAAIMVGETFPFTAVAYDQFNQLITSSLAWSATAGTISGAGSFSAVVPMQNITIAATAPNGVSGSARMSVFGAGANGGSMDLSQAKAYPVPYKSTSGVPGITFSGLTANTTIRIFSTDGRLVQTLHSDGTNVLWPVTNMNHEKVASWVYFYRIENGVEGQLKEGKMVVIQ